MSFVLEGVTLLVFLGLTAYLSKMAVDRRSGEIFLDALLSGLASIVILVVAVAH